MTKKKPVTKKKTTSTKKKTSSAKKKVPVTKKKAPLSARNVPKAAQHVNEHAALAAKHGTDARKMLPSGAIDEYSIDLLPPQDLEAIRELIQTGMTDFQTMADNNLTTLQRRRKIGAGVRNYGFIEKVADLAEANPQYAQFFDPTDLRNAILNFDECRNIALLLQSFVRLVTNTMLIYSNEGFIMSSIFYNAVQNMSRRGDPVANALFNTLRPFFRKTKRASSPTTEKQALRDADSLLKGIKEGKIVIENIAPKLTGGGRKVIDDVHKSGAGFKEAVEEHIDES